MLWVFTFPPPPISEFLFMYLMWERSRYWKIVFTKCLWKLLKFKHLLEKQKQKWEKLTLCCTSRLSRKRLVNGQKISSVNLSCEHDSYGHLPSYLMIFVLDRSKMKSYHVSNVLNIYKQWELNTSFSICKRCI